MLSSDYLKLSKLKKKDFENLGKVELEKLMERVKEFDSHHVTVYFKNIQDHIDFLYNHKIQIYRELAQVESYIQQMNINFNTNR